MNSRLTVVEMRGVMVIENVKRQNEAQHSDNVIRDLIDGDKEADDDLDLWDTMQSREIDMQSSLLKSLSNTLVKYL